MRGCGLLRPQTESEPAKSRQSAEDAPTAHPRPAGGEEPVDPGCFIREGLGQDRPPPGGEQQVALQQLTGGVF